MTSVLGTCRQLLVLMFVCLGLSSVAADGADPVQQVDLAEVTIAIDRVRTVEDITREMSRRASSIGLFHLSITCAPDEPSLERTAILSAALRHEHAWRILGLDCRGNRLIEPPVLTGLIHLTYLDLSNNNLTESPDLNGLPNLTFLNLQRNQLVEPPVLTGLINLEHLELSFNELVQPPRLHGLTNLKRVFLQNNRLVRPPLLNGLTELETLWLHHNHFNRLLLALVRRVQPVIVPVALAGKLNLDFGYHFFSQSYHIEQLDLVGGPENLVDITTPDIDIAVPRFLTRTSVDLLSDPKVNPFTHRPITQTMNLVDSWRYWRDHGMSAEDFDARLRDAEPILFQENMYTVVPPVAGAFMHERGVDEARIAAVLSRFGNNEVNVTALLNLMYAPDLEALNVLAPEENTVQPTFADASQEVLQELCAVS